MAVLKAGITVKAQTASMLYDHEGEEYLLNLIDTPGYLFYEILKSSCQTR
jgi:translation factor GUF1, mitochondrial